MWREVLGDPILRLDRVRHVLKVLVAEADDERDVGIRKGGKDGRVGVVELDATDVEAAEEDGDVRR